MNTIEETPEIQNVDQSGEEHVICPVCQQDLLSLEEGTMLTVCCVYCTQRCHEECMERALRAKDECPLCRGNVSVIFGDLMSERNTTLMRKIGKKFLRDLKRENKDSINADINEIAHRYEETNFWESFYGNYEFLEEAKSYSKVCTEVNLFLLNKLLPSTISTVHEEFRKKVENPFFLKWDATDLKRAYNRFWNMYRQTRLMGIMERAAPPLVDILDQRIKVQAETTMAFWKEDWSHHGDVLDEHRTVALKHEFSEQLKRKLKLGLAQEFPTYNLMSICTENEDIIDKIILTKMYQLNIDNRFRVALEDLEKTTAVSDPQIKTFVTGHEALRKKSKIEDSPEAAVTVGLPLCSPELSFFYVSDSSADEAEPEEPDDELDNSSENGSEADMMSDGHSSEIERTRIANMERNAHLMLGLGLNPGMFYNFARRDDAGGAGGAGGGFGGGLGGA